MFKYVVFFKKKIKRRNYMYASSDEVTDEGDSKKKK